MNPRVSGPPLDPGLAPLLGEISWHSLVVDPGIQEKSEAHFEQIRKVVDQYREANAAGPMRILEVGAYAHTTGYALAADMGAEVALLDVSARALTHGRQLAGREPSSPNPALIAGDFHDLPFEDRTFDLVFASSTVHHTERWARVVSEMLRVLNGQGLLFLENEPCHRQACLYGFRSSRREAFTPFERKLDEAGVLRTFGEPFPGSRPEAWFGMIENQSIPLGGLLAIVGETAEVLETRLSDIGIGALERSWLEARDQGREALERGIYEALTREKLAATPLLGAVERGLGFALPPDEELRRLASVIAAGIQSLPRDLDHPSGRQGLVEIFGAAVGLVARKDGERRPVSGLLDRTCPTTNGILYSFRGPAAQLLLPDRSQLPDIQIASPEERAEFFPPTCWIEDRLPHAVQLVMVSQPAVIRIPTDHEDRVLSLRYHCVPPQGGTARVSLWLEGQEVYARSIWEPSGHLCVVGVPGRSEAGPRQLTLRWEAAADGGKWQPADTAFALAGAGLFRYRQ